MKVKFINLTLAILGACAFAFNVDVMCVVGSVTSAEIRFVLQQPLLLLLGNERDAAAAHKYRPGRNPEARVMCTYIIIFVVP